MNDGNTPTSAHLNRQLQSMEKDLRAYVDAQLAGVSRGGRRRSAHAGRDGAGHGSAAIPTPTGKWLLVFLLVALFAMVAWLGWGISVLSTEVEQLRGKVEGLTQEVEQLRDTSSDERNSPDGPAADGPAADGQLPAGSPAVPPAEPTVETPAS